jgi:hypothetical protein
MIMERSILASNCDVTNSIKTGDCIAEFIESRMKCAMIWSRTANGKRICQSQQDLDNYVNIVFDMNNMKLETELKMFGCKNRNCITNSWRYQNFPSIDTHLIPYNSSTDLSIFYYYMFSDQVK